MNADIEHTRKLKWLGEFPRSAFDTVYFFLLVQSRLFVKWRETKQKGASTGWWCTLMAALITINNPYCHIISLQALFLLPHQEGLVYPIPLSYNTRLSCLDIIKNNILVYKEMKWQGVKGKFWFVDGNWM